MPVRTPALDTLLAALWTKGTLVQIAMALHPTSFDAVRAWYRGRNRPNLGSLKRIARAYPDLAPLVQAVIDEWE